MKNTKEDRERSGVVICGAYGHGNSGDDAILEAIVREIRSLCPEARITVLSRSPGETAEKYGIHAIHTFDFSAFFQVLRSARLYISGGGSLIQDVTSRRSLWYYLFSIFAAKASGCLVCMYGCGIGPVLRPSSRRLAGRVLNRHVDLITLREDHSLEELRLLGVDRPRVVVTSDPALSLAPAPDARTDGKMASEKLSPGGRYLCFALRPWRGFTDERARIFAEAARYAYEAHGLTAVFVPLNHRSDSAAADLVAQFLETPYHIIREPMDASLCMGLFSRMSVVVAMRLHALIFAATVGAPIIGVDYDPKVTAFMRRIGEEGALPFKDVEAEKLRRLLDSALETPRERLRERAMGLREIGARNVGELKKLLEDSQ